MDSMDTFVTNGEQDYDQYETSLSSSLSFLHNITSASANNTLLSKKSYVSSK